MTYKELATKIKQGIQTPSNISNILVEGFENMEDSSSGSTYTTEEQIIGTWLGKTLYQKSWDFGQDIEVGAWTTITDVENLNIDILVSANSSQTNKTVSMIEYWIDGTTLKGNTLRPNTASNYVRYLTLQYTKITN